MRTPKQIVEDSLKRISGELKRPLTKAENKFIRDCYNSIADAPEDRVDIVATNTSFLISALCAGKLTVEAEFNDKESGFYLATTDLQVQNLLKEFGTYMGTGDYHE